MEPENQKKIKEIAEANGDNNASKVIVVLGCERSGRRPHFGRNRDFRRSELCRSIGRSLVGTPGISHLRTGHERSDSCGHL